MGARGLGGSGDPPGPAAVLGPPGMTPRCRRIPQCKSGSSWATEWDATLQRSPALLASLSRHFRRGAHLGTACRGEAGKFRRRPESPLMGLGYSEPIRLSAGGLFGVALHSRAPDGAETRHRPAAWFVHVRSQYSPPAGKSGSRTPSASPLMPARLGVCCGTVCGAECSRHFRLVRLCGGPSFAPA